jgi:hypothetical protein
MPEYDYEFIISRRLDTPDYRWRFRNGDTSVLSEPEFRAIEATIRSALKTDGPWPTIQAGASADPGWRHPLIADDTTKIRTVLDAADNWLDYLEHNDREGEIDPIETAVSVLRTRLIEAQAADNTDSVKLAESADPVAIVRPSMSSFTPDELRRYADIMESNDDQPGFDFWSAVAAADSLDDEAEAIADPDAAEYRAWDANLDEWVDLRTLDSDALTGWMTAAIEAGDVKLVDTISRIRHDRQRPATRPLTRSANAPVAKYEHVSDAPSLDAYVAAVSEEIGYQTDRDVDLELDD